ncbi:hypothetical protein [Enterobacter roggenkampii]|nr:hypothetical protein [Enterobacter roggenkampii]MEB6619583.1 hypothetical protein [Enterobacter roggenkampii]
MAQKNMAKHSARENRRRGGRSAFSVSLGDSAARFCGRSGALLTATE